MSRPPPSVEPWRSPSNLSTLLLHSILDMVADREDLSGGRRNRVLALVGVVAGGRSR